MRCKILGRHTGLRVSELVLGTAMFGTKRGHGADPDESRCVFDGYVEAGRRPIRCVDASIKRTQQFPAGSNHGGRYATLPIVYRFFDCTC